MMKQQLKNLTNRHEKMFGEMQARHAVEFKNKEEDFSKELMELEWKQDVEIKDSVKADEDQLSEALQVQERELAMEGHIRGAESKALQERRVLNSLLDSVVDGVISIDPRGFIVKFKYVHLISNSKQRCCREAIWIRCGRSYWT
jgi:transcriptional regulator with PAS, ATPase and Fis domain